MPIIWDRVTKEGLAPVFLSYLNTELEPSEFNWWVMYAYRSPDLQNELWQKYKAWLDYEAGRSTVKPTWQKAKAAPPGRSAHNYGMAVDVVIDMDKIKPGLQPSWDIERPEWRWLIAFLDDHPFLKSGVSWGDGGHIELRGWETIIKRR